MNHAIDRGVNYLNWCGRPDGMREAIRGLGSRRQQVTVAVQLEARGADAALRELDELHSREVIPAWRTNRDTQISRQARRS